MSDIQIFSAIVVLVTIASGIIFTIVYSKRRNK